MCVRRLGEGVDAEAGVGGGGGGGEQLFLYVTHGFNQKHISL